MYTTTMLTCFVVYVCMTYVLVQAVLLLGELVHKWNDVIYTQHVQNMVLISAYWKNHCQRSFMRKLENQKNCFFDAIDFIEIVFEMIVLRWVFLCVVYVISEDLRVSCKYCTSRAHAREFRIYIITLSYAIDDSLGN